MLVYLAVFLGPFLLILFGHHIDGWKIQEFQRSCYLSK